MQVLPQKRAVVCVVTHGRQDVTLTTAVALLRLQTADVHADVHFVDTLDDALNVLWRNRATHEGMLVCDATVGFDVDFVRRAVSSRHDMVVGVYPLPVVDWQRVATAPVKAPPAEDPSHWGNVYNVELAADAVDAEGYIRVRKATLGLAWIRPEVVRRVVAAHPEIVENGDQSAAFATPGVYAGRRLDASARFLQLVGGDVVADATCPAANTGLAEFGGCVGLRSVLR